MIEPVEYKFCQSGNPKPSLNDNLTWPYTITITEELMLSIIRKHYSDVPDDIRIEGCAYSPSNMIHIDLVKGEE